MKGISINGAKLLELQMPMIPYLNQTTGYLSYPQNRINFHVEENEMVLSIPPLLALELYRRGLLPQDEHQSFPIHVSGKRIGIFKVVDFRYPNSSFDDSVTITMRSQ